MWKRNKYIIIVLGLSFFLNVFSINWGLPEKWHPDEELYVDEVINMGSSLDLKPTAVQHPTFHRYLLVAILLPYFTFIKLNPGAHLNTYLIYFICRLFSAFIGTLTVLLVYLIGRKIWDKRAGIFSSLFLALTMGFVNIAHFATPDITMTFLVTLTILFCVYIVQTGKVKYYLLAGLSSGFAIATKYTAYLLIFSIFVAFFLDEGKKIYQERLNNLNISTVFKIMFIIGLFITGISLMPSVITNLITKYLSSDGVLEEKTIHFLDFLRKTLFGLGVVIVLLAVLLKFFRPLANLLTNVCTNKKIILGLFLSLFSFVVGNPYCLLDFQNFSNGIIAIWDLSKSHFGFPTAQPWLTYIYFLNNIFGFPLFCLCLAGGVYGLFKAYRGNKYFVLFLFWIIPFYIFLSLNRTCYMRYIIPIAPVIVIFAGIITARISSGKRFRRLIAGFFIGIVSIYSFAYVGTLDLMFANDTRYDAQKWIDENIHENSSIDVYSKFMHYLPTIPKVYNIRFISEIDDRGIDGVEFIRFLSKYEEDNRDFLILTSLYYERYLQNRTVYPERTDFYVNLINGEFGYVLLEEFKFRSILKPEPEFVAPTILVFAK